MLVKWTLKLYTFSLNGKHIKKLNRNVKEIIVDIFYVECPDVATFHESNFYVQLYIYFKFYV